MKKVRWLQTNQGTKKTIPLNFDSEKRKRTQKQIGLMGSTTKEKVMIFNYFFSK
jgi:hypothetical protein